MVPQFCLYKSQLIPPRLNALVLPSTFLPLCSFRGPAGQCRSQCRSAKIDPSLLFYDAHSEIVVYIYSPYSKRGGGVERRQRCFGMRLAINQHDIMYYCVIILSFYCSYRPLPAQLPCALSLLLTDCLLAYTKSYSWSCRSLRVQPRRATPLPPRLQPRLLGTPPRCTS